MRHSPHLLLRPLCCVHSHPDHQDAHQPGSSIPGSATGRSLPRAPKESEDPPPAATEGLRHHRVKQQQQQQRRQHHAAARCFCWRPGGLLPSESSRCAGWLPVQAPVRACRPPTLNSIGCCCAALQGGDAYGNLKAWLGQAEGAADRQQVSSSSSSAYPTSSSSRAPAAEQDDGPSTQAHSEHGYAVLGGVDPSSSQQVAGAQQPKLHPTRNFSIRDMYNPTVSPQHWTAC
jgi:hypothetical protein